MNKMKIWQAQYDEHQCPCFVTDKDTVEILYCNSEFLRTFKLEKDIIGRHFYDVVSLAECHMEEAMPDWDKQDYYETESYNETLNMRFLMKAGIDRCNNSVFCVLIPTESDIQANYEFEKAMTRCIAISEKPEAGKSIIEMYTELLADFYDCELAYIYRFDTESVTCLGNWASVEFVPSGAPKVGTEGLTMDKIVQWFRSSDTPVLSIADSKSTKEPPSEVMLRIMETFSVTNVAFCKVMDSAGLVVGFVGISNRKSPESFFDRRFINTITRFVAQEVVQGHTDTALFQLHHRDALTGLYNRDGYSKWISQVLDENPKTLGVISANINGLKFINKEVGIDGGDAHLKSSSKRLKDHFGYDFFRMSGDEFLGIVANIEEDVFEEAALDLHKKMQENGDYDFSFGHAFGSGSINLPKLILEAETIMYINKQEYYSSNQREFTSVRDNTLADLLSYLAADEFMVYLQPQVKLEDGSLYGAEALIRRFDKTNQKMVFPDQFIQLYEDKSVIRHVDIFVVEKVCSLLEVWGKMGQAIPISVNLSRVTLMEFGIVDTIVEICDRYHVPHNLLVIEVTERVGLIENNVASSLITSFKDYGFNISLDDFGCAYSNIVTLAQIQVDEVKIDKSLVDNLTTNKQNHILVKNVLTMCNELDETSTLAEGIEDEQQAKLLHKLGCHLGQGYFYSRPIPVKDFEEKYIHGNEVVR